MNVHKRSTRMVAIGGMLAVFAMAQDARAVGTVAGEDIINQASVQFTVLGSTQTENSLPVTILVDRRVDLTVAEISTDHTMVLAGASQQALGFTVTNTGNDTFDVLLSAVQAALGTTDPHGGLTTDSFDSVAVVNAEFYLDDGAGSLGVFDVSDDTLLATNTLDDLAADDGVGTETVTVWVVHNIPTDTANPGPGSNPGDLAVVHLVAEARDTAGAVLPNNNADNDLPGTVQNVIADGAGTAPGDIASDARHSDVDAYLVENAAMTILKASEVVSDPTGAVAPLAKAIPGAVVEYTITINNTGTAQATAVTITDDLSTEIGAGTVAFDETAYGGAPGPTGLGTRLSVNGGAFTPFTNQSGDDQGEFVGNVVQVDGITLPAGQNAVVNFRVVIQ